MPKDHVVLLVRPNYDRATKFLHKWDQEVIDDAKRLGLKVLDLAEIDATREKVEKALKTEDSGIFIHYGHGREDALMGQHGETIIDFENVDLLEGRITCAVSCLSAKKLGPAIERFENTAYIGWPAEYVFSADEDYALPFKEIANFTPMMLFRGTTVKTL